MGRTKITPHIEKLIAECLFDGLTDADIATLTDLDVRTIERCRAGTLCRAIKKAELARKRHYIALIRDGRQRDWVRIAWFLERRYPNEFARPEIQLSFNNNYTQNNLSISIDASQAKAIEADAKPIRERVESMFKQYRPQAIDQNGE